jgi:putative hemolysin
VATAEKPFGKAEELPWKAFAARLIQQSGATVLPVYFEGQNSAVFHLISRYSLSLRLSLLVLEFRHHIGATIHARMGLPVPWAEIEAGASGSSITDELYLRVHRLAPGAESADRAALLPRPIHLRRRYPWDPPPRRPTGGGAGEKSAAAAETSGSGSSRLRRLNS